MNCDCRSTTLEEVLEDRGKWTLDGKVIKFCPLHEAAGEMLKVCRLMDSCFKAEGPFYPLAALKKHLATVIAKAENTSER